jgi:hypothetical protein
MVGRGVGAMRSFRVLEPQEAADVAACVREAARRCLLNLLEEAPLPAARFRERLQHS